MQIQERNTSNAAGNALLNLGFRIFFPAAGIFSIISIALWSAIYVFNMPIPIESLTAFQWHAHEMIYGYSVAVIAGFLLTAAKNWTGVQTLTGIPLLLIFSLWAMARLLFLAGTSFIPLAGFLDILFLFSLLLSISYPVIKVKQWKQLPILIILGLLMTANIFFYLGVFDIVSGGATGGIYAGLYLIIGLVLVMGGRVIPFFIERGAGTGPDTKLSDSNWVSISNHVIFLAFVMSELFIKLESLSAYLAVTLFLLNVIRLIGWHTPGIWKKSLLWSLYLSFCFLTLGFLLFAAGYFAGVSKFLAIHAFAFGGIGMVTLSMMSRVSLGHTGRSIDDPPRAVAYALGILILGAIIRVIVPLFDTNYYIYWVGISQALWIISFLIFTIVYLPMFTKPRIDGQPG